MADKKPKEPLLSILLTFIYPGLGQIYSGYVRRGVLFVVVPVSIFVALGWYAVLPGTKTYTWMLGLLIVGVVFGLFVIVDSCLCAKRFNKANNLERKITAGKRILYIVGILICIFVIDVGAPITNYVKNNIVEAFTIPAGAMRLTLVEGDRLLVDKRAYKNTPPQRGDIVVFIFPEDESRDFIKRIVGLPGESLEIRDGRIVINGQELDSSPKISHFYYYNRGPLVQPGMIVNIPDGHYFVLGDNSKSSHDSRYWGFVPAENILGKAYKIYYPFERSGQIL